jgi:hypothetical protein
MACTGLPQFLNAVIYDDDEDPTQFVVKISQIHKTGVDVVDMSRH